MELQHERSRPPSTIDNLGAGRAHLPHTSSAAQKNVLSSPSAMQAKESNRSIKLPTEEGKEDAAHKLLQMMRRNTKGFESETSFQIPDASNLVPFGDVVGCLAIRIKNCSGFSTRLNLPDYTSLFVRISVNNISKCTKIRQLPPRRAGKVAITFDDMKYFSVQVPRRQHDDRNKIYIDLMKYDEAQHEPVMLGGIEMHLYEVIQKGCFMEEFKLESSITLKPLQKVIEPSMFMNVPPPPERRDPITKILLPQPVEYPAFLSPDLNVSIGRPWAPPENQPSAVQLEKLQQEPRERLKKMQQEYRDLGTWLEKASYLEKLLTPKLDQREPKVIDNEEQPEELVKEKPEEDVAAADVPPVEEQPQTIPEKLPSTGEKRRSTIPAVDQPAKPLFIAGPPKVDEPKKEAIPPPSLPTRPLEEKRILPVETQQPQVKPERKPHGRPKDRYPDILRTDSSLSEKEPLLDSTFREPEILLPEILFSPSDAVEEDLNYPYLSDEVPKMTLPNAQKNTNKKGKSVVFVPKRDVSPYYRSDYPRYKPRYQDFDLNTSWEPLIRSVTPLREKKGQQDTFDFRLFTDSIDYEDQDPPYPTHPDSNNNRTQAPAIILIEPLASQDNFTPGIVVTPPTMKDTENELTEGPDTSEEPGDTTYNFFPDISATPPKTSSIETILDQDPDTSAKPLDILDLVDTTTKKSDGKNNFKGRRGPRMSLPNFERKSSLPEGINAMRLARSLSLSPQLENSRPSMLLKSVLSKNLQDLSDKLFSELEVPVDTKALQGSHSSQILSIHSEPSNHLEAEPSIRSEESGTWELAKDISQIILNQIINGTPPENSFSTSGPGSISEVQTELTSNKSIESDVVFPTRRKSSSKSKHLEGEVSKSRSNGITHDYDVKQIFTAPQLSELETGELSQTQMTFQDQLPTVLEDTSSNLLGPQEEKEDEIELSAAKSVISQIIQAFPVDTLLGSGIIKVVELDKEPQKSFSQDSKAVFSGETDDKSVPFPEQDTFVIPKEITSLHRVQFVDQPQDISSPASEYQSTPKPDEKPDMPSSDQQFGRKYLSPTLEQDSVTDTLAESDVTTIETFLKNIFYVFFKYSYSERTRQPEKELNRLISQTFLNDIKNLEEIQECFNNIGKLPRQPVLSPKLRAFLKELSEPEVKKFKSELSKYIQHYLVEKLSESGHITKEDLPKIYQNLYLLNEKGEPKGQMSFLEKYSGIISEIIAFINNFSHHFIDKNLETKIRSLLSEIFQNYFLKTLSGSSLFKERKSKTAHPDLSSLRTKSTSISFHEVGQGISNGSFGKRVGINVKYPLRKSLRNNLVTLPENELLEMHGNLSRNLYQFFIEKTSNLITLPVNELLDIHGNLSKNLYQLFLKKTNNLTNLPENELLDVRGNLRKHLYQLFIDKLSKSGLISEEELEQINQQTHWVNSSSTSLKCIKPDLSSSDENRYMENGSDKQDKFPKIVQKTKASEDRRVEAGLVGKEEKDYFFLLSTKENPSTARENKKYYPVEEPKSPNAVKEEDSSNKNTQSSPLAKSPVSLVNPAPTKQDEHGFLQFTQVKKFVVRTKNQEPSSRSSTPQTPHSNACFERIQRAEFLEKKEQSNSCKVTMAQEKPEEVLLTYPRISNCKMQGEDEKHVNRLNFPSRKTYTLTYVNSEAGEKPTLNDQYCQKLKGNNNNNKKRLSTLSQNKKERQTAYLKLSETCLENYAQISELQAVRYEFGENERISKSSFLPDVLRTENLKLKRERDHVSRQKKSFNKVDRLLPTTLPSTRVLKKSVPKTMLHWTARTTIHDCLDRFEEPHMDSFPHLEKVKSRTSFTRKSPDHSHHQPKHSARPYTAPEFNKRRENCIGKHTSPRLVSAGLVHANDSVLDYENHKVWQRRLRREH